MPIDFRKNRTPCWDTECETLYQDFLQFLDYGRSSRAASTLLTILDKKCGICWSEAVKSINFSNSIGWSSLTISLAGKTSQLTPLQHSSLITGNTKVLIASQRDSYLQTVNISGDFKEADFAAALQKTKPNTTSGADSNLTSKPSQLYQDDGSTTSCRRAESRHNVALQKSNL